MRVVLPSLLPTLKVQPVRGRNFLDEETIKGRDHVALITACAEFHYRISDVTIESWHLHWILFHGDDPIEKVMGRLKTRMRQALARGKIWTERILCRAAHR